MLQHSKRSILFKLCYNRSKAFNPLFPSLLCCSKSVRQSNIDVSVAHAHNKTSMALIIQAHRIFLFTLFPMLAILSVFGSIIKSLHSVIHIILLKKHQLTMMSTVLDNISNRASFAVRQQKMPCVLGSSSIIHSQLPLCCAAKCSWAAVSPPLWRAPKTPSWCGASPVWGFLRCRVCRQA